MLNRFTLNFCGKILLVSWLLMYFSCSSDPKKLSDKNSTNAAGAKGHAVPADSITAPDIIVVDENTLKKIAVGKPKIVSISTNAHSAGIPEVVPAGQPRISIPGQGGFTVPKKVPALDRPFATSIPEIVLVKERAPQNFNSFDKLQGLKSGQINCFVEDKSGNLWIGMGGGGGGGVTKYDGQSFTHFTEKEGLSSNLVRSILEDRKGNLWFATGKGISRYDGKSFTHFTEAEGFSDNAVFSILEDRAGNLWFGTEREGVYKYDGKSFTHFAEPEGFISNAVFSIFQDRAGNLWFGTFIGVYKFDGKSFAHFTANEGLSGNYVLSILEDRSGKLWFATYGGGVSKYDGKSFAHFTEKQGLTNTNVRNLIEDRFGHLWLGTDGGVFSYDGTSFTHFTEKEGLCGNTITGILEDRSGNLWFGTEFGGVCKYDGRSMRHFTEKEGLNKNGVWCILEDQAHRIWIGTQGGVYRYDGKSFTHFTEKQGLSSNGVTSMLEDRSGNLWFGTFGGGLTKYDGTTFTHITEKQGLSSNGITSIIEDRSGNLWFGTYGGGVYKYNGKSFTHFTKKQGLSSDGVTSMTEDRSGHLWFATDGGGLTKYDGKTFTHFTVKEGLSGNNITSIIEDRSGNLWIATREGVSKFDGKSFTLYTEKEGIIYNVVLSILEDKAGGFWFGTRFGWGQPTLEKTDPTNRKARSKNYTYEDGFWNSTDISALCESHDGTIWIGTSDGLTAYHPPTVTDSVAPNIQMNRIELFNENIPWVRLNEQKDTTLLLSNGVTVSNVTFDDVSNWYGLPQNLSLPYDNNNLNFNFVGITLSQSQKAKYQYRLVGLEKNWSTVTDRTSASYGSLPPGTFIFKVKAMTGKGVWSPEFDYRFTIRPPWWKTWWAYGTYLLLLVVGLLRLYFYLRERTVRKEREKALARELEQAKEIEKAYTALGVAHETLKSTQAQLIKSEKLASIGQLTKGIVDRILNPLNYINNFSESSKMLVDELTEMVTGNKDVLSEATVDDFQDVLDLIKNSVSKIYDHGNSTSRIVKDMQKLLKEKSTEFFATDLNEFVETRAKIAFQEIKPGYKEFRGELVFELEKQPIKTNILPPEFGDVITALIDNAMYTLAEKSKVDKKFTPEIRLSTVLSNEGIILKVRDNGKGISPRDLERIFSPFFTTKPTSVGTGLGLFMSKDTIELHNGTIQIQSKENEFTELTIVLPNPNKSPS